MEKLPYYTIVPGEVANSHAKDGKGLAVVGPDLAEAMSDHGEGGGGSGCLTSHATIFQSYMWRHMGVQAD